MANNIALTRIISEIFAGIKSLNEKIQTIDSKLERKFAHFEAKIESQEQNIKHLIEQNQVILNIFYPPSNTISYDTYNTQKTNIENNLDQIKSISMEQLNYQNDNNKLINDLSVQKTN